MRTLRMMGWDHYPKDGVSAMSCNTVQEQDVLINVTRFEHIFERFYPYHSL